MSLADRLSAKLADDDVEVRCAAAEALGEVAVTLESAAALAQAIRTDTSDSVRAKCTVAIGRLGPDVMTAQGDAIVGALADDAVEVRLAAIQALGTLGGPALAASHAVPTLACMLAQPAAREAVQMLLASLDTASFVEHAAVEVVSHLRRSDDADVRRAAIELLAQHDATRLVGISAFGEPMLGALRDADAGVRSVAVALVGTLEAAADHGRTPLLTAALADPDPPVRSEALRALARLGSRRLLAAIGSVIDACGDGDGSVRKSACLALGTLPPAELAHHVAAVDALVAMMDGDAASYVRAAAVEVLTQLDRAMLTTAQASALEKHLQGLCHARKAYEGKHAACA